jgi:hypothetical protein
MRRIVYFIDTPVFCSHLFYNDYWNSLWSPAFEIDGTFAVAIQSPGGRLIASNIVNSLLKANNFSIAPFKISFYIACLSN